MNDIGGTHIASFRNNDGIEGQLSDFLLGKPFFKNRGVGALVQSIGYQIQLAGFVTAWGVPSPFILYPENCVTESEQSPYVKLRKIFILYPLSCIEKTGWIWYVNI